MVDQDGDGKVNLRDAFSFIDRDGDSSIGIADVTSDIVAVKDAAKGQVFGAAKSRILTMFEML